MRPRGVWRQETEEERAAGIARAAAFVQEWNRQCAEERLKQQGDKR